MTKEQFEAFKERLNKCDRIVKINLSDVEKFWKTPDGEKLKSYLATEEEE